MKINIPAEDIWTTREGVSLPIKSMASSHLLSTLHMIERNRLMKMAECAFNGEEIDIIAVYAQWPAQYENLVKEAQRRKLIFRGEDKETKELTKIPKNLTK